MLFSCFIYYGKIYTYTVIGSCMLVGKAYLPTAKNNLRKVDFVFPVVWFVIAIPSIAGLNF